MITIAFKQPALRFYITTIRNADSELSEWKELAQNFGISFSTVPVPENEWSHILSKFKAAPQHVQQVAQSVLYEMKNTGITAMITIP